MTAVRTQITLIFLVSYYSDCMCPPLYIRKRPGLDTIVWPPAVTWHLYWPTSSSAALLMMRLPCLVRTRVLVLTTWPFFSHWTSLINWFKCLALQWNWTSAPGIASASVGSSTKYKSRGKKIRKWRYLDGYQGGSLIKGVLKHVLLLVVAICAGITFIKAKICHVWNVIIFTVTDD